MWRSCGSFVAALSGLPLLRAYVLDMYRENLEPDRLEMPFFQASKGSRIAGIRV